MRFFEVNECFIERRCPPILEMRGVIEGFSDVKTRIRHIPQRSDFDQESFLRISCDHLQGML